VEGKPEMVAARPYTDIPRVSFWQFTWTIIKNPALKLTIDKVLKELFDKLGPIFTMNLPLKGDQVFLLKPEDAQELLAGEGKHPVEPGFDHWVYYRSQVRRDLYPAGGGLIGSHGEDWQTVRSAVQQDMLRPKSAVYYLSSLQDISDQLATVLDNNKDANNEIDDLTKHLYRWSMESIGSIFLNTRLGCLDENLAKDSDTNKFIEAVMVVLGMDGQEVAGGIPIWRYLPRPHKTIPYYKRFDEASTTVYHISSKYIQQAIERMEATPSSSDGEKMSVLEKLVRKCGKDSTIPVVMAQDAIMAGVDTTGNTAAMLLYDLATHPEHQEKVYSEIQAEIGDTGRITEKNLNRMKYLKACLSESMRLHPIVFGMGRRTPAPAVLAGYHVPPGSIVYYAAALAVGQADQFPQPEVFRPERWLRGCPAQHSAHPFAAIPFSHGPRMCIGRRFATLECYVLVVAMLQRFRLEYHHAPVGLATEMIYKPDKPIRLKLLPR